MAQHLLLSIEEKEKLDDQLFRVRFRPVDQDIPGFLPGQFMSLEVTNRLRRSYSVVNPPHEGDFLETVVDTRPGGPGSHFFDGVQEGDEAQALFPLGKFVYQNQQGDSLRPAYFFATGTGIVPILSMIRHELGSVKSEREIHLFFGVRTTGRVIANKVLEQLANKYSNFHWHQYVSREKDLNPNWKKGRITDGVEEACKSANFCSSDFYLCGGRPMIEDMERLLVDKGVARERIFCERFF